MEFKLSKIREDFPMFATNPKLVYLDNAATSWTPKTVLEAMDKYYQSFNSNIHRGVYDISIKASAAYEEAGKIVADFINASEEEEVVFTSGATHGLNIIAFGLAEDLTAEDNIVLTRMEHHANLVPWQQVAQKTGCELRFIELDGDYQLDIASAAKLIDSETKVVSLIHVSNTLGTINPVEEVIALAKQVEAITIVDAAQSAPHMKIDVQKLNCDFLVFSGHKICGPKGIGVLYGKRERLEALPPFIYGGDMIAKVGYEKSTWNEIPYKFEAGTPNIPGAIGLSKAIKYLEKVGFDNIAKHERELTAFALEKLSEIEGLKIIGTKDLNKRVGSISFIIEGVHHYDLGLLLDQFGVAVRTGHHCTMPLMKHLGVEGTIRASLYFYNSKQDVELLISAIKKSLKTLK